MKKVFIILLFTLLLFYAGSCEKEVATSFSDENVVEYQTFDISSNPLGAVVFIDGKNSGYTTPCKIKWIEKKNISVKLKLSPYFDYTFDVNANMISSNPYFYDFLLDDRYFGEIYCKTVPSGAEIVLNKEHLNQTTPFTITKIRPGNYKVKFELKDYRYDSTVVSVPVKRNDNDIVYVTSTLVDTSLFVDYTRQLPIYNCNYVYTDNTKMIWICTSSQGVYLYFNGVFKKMFNSFLTTQNVYFIFKDSKGKFWIATDAGLIETDINGNYRIFNSQNSSIKSNKANSICEDNEHTIWLCTDNGLYRFYKEDPMMIEEQWVEYPLPFSSSSGNNISAVGCSTDGSIWVALAGYYKFLKFYSGSWTVLSLTSVGWYNANIFCSKDNTVYYAIDNAAFQYVNGIWSSLPVTGIGNIRKIYIDSKMNILIAGSLAIKIIKKDGSSEIISTKINGLSNFLITSITEDADKNIWLSTSNWRLVRFKYFKK